jgi:mRNA-degrading endonuclease YafQ of YafQ-DinJ toxin-antitoxin module
VPSAIQKLATERDLIFRANSFDARLKTHTLKGKFKGLWSYSVDYRHRVLFEFLAHDEVMYHDIGPHDVYR